MLKSNLSRAWASGVFALFVVAGCTPEGSNPPVDNNEDTPAERGRLLYESRRCINCHGADGLGISVFPGAPRVVGRQAADISTVLVDECANPDDVTNCHPVKMPDLTGSQIDDIAAYLAALGGNAVEDPGPACDDVPGNICTIAGNGVSGNKAGNNSYAREEYLFWPQNVVMDPQGRVVVNDWNNYTIKRIETAGCIMVPDKNGKMGPDCPIIDLVGTGLLGDSCSMAGSPVLGADAIMNHVSSFIFDDLIPGQHNLLIGAWHQWKVKYVPIDENGVAGEIMCLWGNERGAGPDDIAAGYEDFDRGQTRFNLPSSVVYDRNRNFYIADQGNLRIRIIRPDADDDYSSAETMVTTLRNNIVSRFLGGLVDEFGNFRRTKPDYSDSGDGGSVFDATINVQSGFDAVPQLRLAMDQDRQLLYIADSENQRIRVVDLNQDPPTIDTFAGGGDDLVADNVPATQAKFKSPADVDVAPDGSGDILISDSFNHCVRLVDFETRLIRTVAGICGPDQGGYEGDAGPATQARLNEAGGAAIAADGTIYIADTLNHRIRKVNPVR